MYPWSKFCTEGEYDAARLKSFARQWNLPENLSPTEICKMLNDTIEKRPRCINEDDVNLEGDKLSDLPKERIYSARLEDGRYICYDIKDLCLWIDATPDYNAQGQPRLSPGREFVLVGDVEEEILQRHLKLIGKLPRSDVKTVLNRYSYRILYWVRSDDRRHNRPNANFRGIRVRRRWVFFSSIDLRRDSDLTSWRRTALAGKIFSEFTSSLGDELLPGFYSMFRLNDNNEQLSEETLLKEAEDFPEHVGYTFNI